jgi:heme/copper-type cytochrome/quinol oxidase subunit 4
VILGIIIACEIGFWAVIVLGLVARYIVKAKGLGLVLIALAPVIDLVLLTTTAMHLRSGADAEWAHGLAAVYIGFSIAYGPGIVRWADIHFSHRFANGPEPIRLSGTDYTVACWKDVARTLLAAAISALVLVGLIWLVGNAAQTAALEHWYPILMAICGIEVIWAASYTIWPRTLKQNAAAA